MTTPLRSSRLCQKCRLDFLRVLESGFCRPVATLSPFAPRQRRRPIPSTRSFSTSKRFREAPSTRELSEDIQQDDEQLHEADTVQDQIEALKQLEGALGRPIDDAIEEDRVLAGDKPSHDAPTLFDTQPHESEPIEPQDRLAELRKNGTDATDIARGARKVFGERLPAGVLYGQELKIYKRLYGDPLPEVQEVPQELEDDELDADVSTELLDQEGASIDYEAMSDEQDDLDHERSPIVSIAGIDTLDAKVRIARDSLGGEVLDEGDNDIDDDQSDFERSHPLTALGRFGTRPRTVSLPSQQYTESLNEVMAKYSNKHLKDACEKVFGGPGLPDSPLTPRSGIGRQQVAVQLQASQQSMGQMDANAFLAAVMPPAYAASMSVLSETRKRLGSTWLTNLITKEGGARILDAGAGGAGILAWNEVVSAHWQSLSLPSRKSPPPVPSSKPVVLTGSDTLRSRAAAMLENTTFVPRLPNYTDTRDQPTLDDDRPVQPRKEFDVIISSYSLLPFTEDWEKKQYVENLWSMVSPQGGVLILIEKGMPRGFEAIAGAREMLLEHHVAIPPEQSTHYASKHQFEDPVYKPVTGMIIAPCTNHERCPMYRIPGAMAGRKDFCSFEQRYIRPPHLQRVLGASSRNHDDVDFSYISVMKGRDLRQNIFKKYEHVEDPATTKVPSLDDLALGLSVKPGNTQEWLAELQQGFSDVNRESRLAVTATDETHAVPSLSPTHLMPRLVYSPLKRRGHIILDMCTPMGTIERWTVPRSFSKQAYRDARKSQWGDLWALGAKTRIPRSLNLGTPKSELKAKPGKKGKQTKEQAQQLYEQKILAQEDKMHEDRMEQKLDALEAERFKYAEEDGDEDDEQLDEKLDAFEEAVLSEFEAQYKPEAFKKPKSVRLQKEESRIRRSPPSGKW